MALWRNMNNKFLYLIIFLIFPLNAKVLPKRVTFSPVECVVSGDDNGKIKRFDGVNSDLLCEVNNNEIKCSQLGGSAEVYEIIVNDNGVLIVRSISGNIFLLGDTLRMTYSMASSHLITSKMALMTKHCMGKIK